MVDAPDYFKYKVDYLLLINLNKDNGMMGKYIGPNIFYSCAIFTCNPNIKIQSRTSESILQAPCSTQFY